jgi:stringent starvation protein B
VAELSKKPYLVRAIYDWCVDSGWTPYLAVQVGEQTVVPMAYVKDGEIVRNLGTNAVPNLHISNDDITGDARFGGVSHKIFVPMGAVIGIFAKETGQGLVFQRQDTAPDVPAPAPASSEESPPDTRPPAGKPHLRVVK